MDHNENLGLAKDASAKIQERFNLEYVSLMDTAYMKMGTYEGTGVGVSCAEETTVGTKGQRLCRPVVTIHKKVEGQWESRSIYLPKNGGGDGWLFAETRKALKALSPETVTLEETPKKPNKQEIYDFFLG